MFGNRLGWGISVGIVLFTVVLLWALQRRGSEAIPPSQVGRDAHRYKLTMPHVQPREVAAPFMTEPGNAIELYTQAIAGYQADRGLFTFIQSHGDFKSQRESLDSAERERVEACLKLLIQASRKKDAGVFADRPAAVINYKEKDELLTLYELGRVCEVLGTLYHKSEANKDLRKAKDLYEARFALGMKLWEERLFWEELDVGLRLMDVTGWMADVATEENETARAELLKRFDDQRIGYYKEQIEPVQKRFYGFYSEPGDMIAFAKRGGDPMWRTEAVLQLGRSKFDAVRRPDKNAAVALIDELTASSDQNIRLAALAAKALPVEEYRKFTAPWGRKMFQD